MFSKQSLISITKTSSRCLKKPTLITFKRHTSSIKLETAEEKEKIKLEADKKTKLEENKKKFEKIPFMPVINIPETEFAHNAFFSLHRPLLGLSDQDEKPFFSNKPTLSEQEQEQQRLDDILSVYMSNLQPFVEPSSPGSEPTLQEHEENYIVAEENRNMTQVSIETTEEIHSTEASEDLMIEKMDYHDKTLPVFHMPESPDVLDFLSSVEQKMKNENKKLEKQEAEQATRLQKLKLISYSQQLPKPRFFNSNRNVHQRLRRLQLQKKFKSAILGDL